MEIDNIPVYQSLLSSNLAKIRELWAQPDSSTSISILLKCTNDALSLAAKHSNKHVILNRLPKNKPSVPIEIKSAQQNCIDASGNLKSVLANSTISNYGKGWALYLDICDKMGYNPKEASGLDIALGLNLDQNKLPLQIC